MVVCMCSHFMIKCFVLTFRPSDVIFLNTLREVVDPTVTVQDVETRKKWLCGNVFNMPVHMGQSATGLLDVLKAEHATMPIILVRARVQPIKTLLFFVLVIIHIHIGILKSLVQCQIDRHLESF